MRLSKRADKGKDKPSPKRRRRRDRKRAKAVAKSLGEGAAKQGKATPRKDEPARGQDEPSNRRGKAPAIKDEASPGRQRPGRKRGGAGARKATAAVREGGKETRRQLQGTPTKLLGRIAAGIAAIAGIVVAVGRGLLKLAGSWLRGSGPSSGRRRRSYGAGCARVVTALSRAITPARGLLIAAIGCAVLLGLSQFADYRGVAIGVDDYDPAIAAVAPAPEVGRAELGSAHSYLMVPVALLAIAVLLLASLRGRWKLCRLVALIGVLVLVVSLGIDRPTGLDEGSVARDFAGAEAKLLGGFWVQVFAGIGLIVTSLLLGREIRRDGSSRERSRGGSERARRERRKPRTDVAPRRATTKGAGA